MISSLFDRIWTRPKEDNAKTVAKKRLQFLLVHDRVFLSPAQMECLKQDLLEVLSRYVELDNSKVDVELRPMPDSPRQMALVSNVPIQRVKDDGDTGAASLSISFAD